MVAIDQLKRLSRKFKCYNNNDKSMVLILYESSVLYPKLLNICQWEHLNFWAYPKAQRRQLSNILLYTKFEFQMIALH